MGALIALLLALDGGAGSPVLATLQRSDCFGFCPSYVVTIHENGTVDWEGRAYVDVLGKRPSIATLDRAQLDGLVAAFSDAGFLEMKETASKSYVTDNPTVTTSFQYAGRARTIADYHGEHRWPPSLRKLEDQIDMLVGTARFIGAEHAFVEVHVSARTSIYVDGAQASGDADVERPRTIRVTAGHHTLRFVHDSETETSREVDIKPATTLPITVTFDAQPRKK